MQLEPERSLVIGLEGLGVMAGQLINHSPARRQISTLALTRPLQVKAHCLRCSLCVASSRSFRRCMRQSSYPMLMGLKPLAAQIGQTTEHEVNAPLQPLRRQPGLCQRAGVTGEVRRRRESSRANRRREKKPELPKIKLRFTVAADAVPGARSFRVATPQGASTVGQVVLVRDPVVIEADNNDTSATAQAVTLPATLCGAIEKAEDVDFFKFTVAENTAWTFHVQSSRCEDKIHDLQVHSDPILILRNASGTVLATNDNYFYGDPLLHHRFTAAGEYFLEIRDVRYQGNVDWQYSIEANDRPFVTNVFPSRVTPGTATRVQLVGFNLPADPTCLVTLPPGRARRDAVDQSAAGRGGGHRRAGGRQPLARDRRVRRRQRRRGPGAADRRCPRASAAGSRARPTSTALRSRPRRTRNSASRSSLAATSRCSTRCCGFSTPMAPRSRKWTT